MILFDEEENKIALHFTLNDPKFGLAVRIPNDQQGGMVVARSFFDLKNIDVKKYSRRYDFDKVDLRNLGIDKDGSAYVITLTEKQNEQPSEQNLEFEPDDAKPIDLSEIPF